MKKLLGILVLGLFIGFNPLVIKFSYAGLLDVFKDPLEVCMDRLEARGVWVGDAAKNCAGSTRATLKCMDKLEARGVWVGDAAKNCTGNN